MMKRLPIRHLIFWLIGTCCYSIGLPLVLAQDVTQPAQMAPPEPFLSFRDVLEEQIKKRGIDPQHQAFHFVVLLNVTTTTGPTAQWMRNIYEGLLQYYLQPQDKVSFVPYQFKVRTESAVWGQDFNRTDIPALAKRATDSNPAIDEKEGGHDDLAALQTALDQAQTLQLLNSTVFILLSDKDVSHSDFSQKHRLTDPQVLQQKLKGMHIEEMWKHDFRGIARYPALQGSQESEARVWCTLYLPQELKPLGPVGTKRDELIPKPPFPWLRVVLGILVLIVAGASIYLFWLRLPRRVQVQHMIGEVRYGSRLYIGGDDAGTSVDTIILSGLIDRGQRVAFVEITLSGSVMLYGHGSYDVMRLGDKPGVQLDNTQKTVQLKNMRTKDIDYSLAVKIV